jgi:hypothetical protein
VSAPPLQGGESERPPFARGGKWTGGVRLFIQTEEIHSLREASVIPQSGIPTSLSEFQRETNDGQLMLRSAWNLHRCTDSRKTSNVLPLSANFCQAWRSFEAECVVPRIQSALEDRDGEVSFLGVEKGRGRTMGMSATQSFWCCTPCLEGGRRTEDGSRLPSRRPWKRATTP